MAHKIELAPRMRFKALKKKMRAARELIKETT